MFADLAKRFRFTLWPTLFTIPAVLVMLGLGTWQVQRLEWKNNLIATREAALVAPAVPAPRSLEAAKALDFHHVAVDGVFDHAKELYIGAFDARGVEGFQIVTPLVLEDGATLLINRGWVPEQRKRPETREAGQIAGPVHVEGILRLDAPPTGWVVPRNRPGDNFWFFVDIKVMAETVGVKDPLPFFIEASAKPANPGGWPLGGQTRISLPNDHLQYAATWYIFALTLVIIYFVYHYRKPDAEALAP